MGASDSLRQKKIKFFFVLYLTHPHTLRHTFATRCFDEGINPKIVQAYLGHKSVNTTLDIYTDINESQKTHNILMLEDAMNETIRRRAE